MDQYKEAPVHVIKPITIALDNVVAEGGAYSHTTTIATSGIVTEGMKPIGIEVGTPSVFRAKITVTVGDGEVTLACANAYGTSTVNVTLMRVTPASTEHSEPAHITSEEFDILADRIEDLDEEIDAQDPLYSIRGNVTSGQSLIGLTEAKFGTGYVYGIYNFTCTGTLPTDMPNTASAYGTGWINLCGYYHVLHYVGTDGVEFIGLRKYTVSSWTFYTIGNKSKINYIDITGSNSQIQVNSASGSVVSSANFINAYVVGSNSIVCLPYTYSGYVYVNLRSLSTMAEVGSGTYTVRVLYYS